MPISVPASAPSSGGSLGGALAIIDDLRWATHEHGRRMDGHWIGCPPA
jgi:hypothetical protein